MRRSVRAFAGTDPRERLARTVTRLPIEARAALADVAERTDLPLIAGTWTDGPSGCLVANVVVASGVAASSDAATLDLQVLDAIPELSSRDLNRLIVAWDESAAALRRTDDAGLRQLLRDALSAADRADPVG